MPSQLYSEYLTYPWRCVEPTRWCSTLTTNENVVSIYEPKRSKSVNLVVVVVSSPYPRSIGLRFFSF